MLGGSFTNPWGKREKSKVFEKTQNLCVKSLSKSRKKVSRKQGKVMISMKDQVFMVVDEVWTQCGRSVAVKKSRKAWKNFEKD